MVIGKALVTLCRHWLVWILMAPTLGLLWERNCLERECFGWEEFYDFPHSFSFTRWIQLYKRWELTGNNCPSSSHNMLYFLLRVSKYWVVSKVSQCTNLGYNICFMMLVVWYFFFSDTTDTKTTLVEEDFNVFSGRWITEITVIKHGGEWELLPLVSNKELYFSVPSL